MTIKKLALFAVVLLFIHQITATELSDEDTFTDDKEAIGNSNSEEETQIQSYLPQYHSYYDPYNGYYPPPPPPPPEHENMTYYPNYNGTNIRPGVMGFNPMYPMMSMIAEADMDRNGTSNSTTYGLPPYGYMPPLPPPPPMYQPMYPAEYNPEMEPEIHDIEVEEL